MPIVASRFRPPFFLRNGHLQTILPAFLQPIGRVTFEPERLELEDGDFLDLDWVRTGADKVAVFTHGLEGSSKDANAQGLMAWLVSKGWDLLAWNFRGCGRDLNRLARFYHSGETGDLNTVMQLVSTKYSRIVLIGVSLGGNVILKYLGERIPHPSIVAAVAISVPVDLASSAAALDRRWSNRIYLNRFIKSLVSKVEKKALRFPDQFDLAGLRSIRTFKEFDERYTAPIHGFRDAADYWEQSSSRRYLGEITLPTLLLSARDDPLLTSECFPFADAERNANLFLETPRSGGHVGFIDLTTRLERWWERRAAEFLTWVEEHKGDRPEQAKQQACGWPTEVQM
jgi:predicted alpha/beta-fold hydrolase